MEAYLAFVELALLFVVPILGFLTLFSWWLAWKSRPYKLAVIIAIKNTVTLFGAGWLAWTVLYRSRIGVIPNEFLPVTATAILAMCVGPFLTTAYLAWLRARQTEDGARTPRRRHEDGA